MPTTDAFGQGVQIYTLTDRPDLERLARDLANGIIPRSTMRFADAAERNATLTAPAPGMLCYLEAEDQFTGYTAGGWMVLAAGSQAWTKPTLVSGYTHNGNSNGDFRWRKVNLFGETAIFLEGAIGVTYSPDIPNGGVFLASPLPTSARPTSLRTVSIPCSDVGSERITLKLDARTNGQLAIYGTNSTTNRPAWIGFNGVFYTL